jgi:hypothetical protein
MRSIDAWRVNDGKPIERDELILLGVFQQIGAAAVRKTKSPIRHLVQNSTKPLCQPQDSDNFCCARSASLILSLDAVYGSPFINLTSNTR